MPDEVPRQDKRRCREDDGQGSENMSRLIFVVKDIEELPESLAALIARFPKDYSVKVKA